MIAKIVQPETGATAVGKIVEWIDASTCVVESAFGSRYRGVLWDTWQRRLARATFPVPK